MRGAHRRRWRQRAGAGDQGSRSKHRPDDFRQAGEGLDLALGKAVRGRVALEQICEAGTFATVPVKSPLGC